jgi:gamma-glutamylcyclotransferase (GGCT)/AIG2-like uncharacterized protein YtfP
MTLPSLFVYGTLRDPDVRTLVLGRPIAPANALPATAPGHAAVFYPGRTYPALIEAPGGAAPGTLLTGLTADDLAVLDAFEGPEYARRPVEIIVSGTPRTADVYWPAIEIVATAPPWHLGAWTSRHKAAFLAAETRNLAELRQHLTDLAR